MKKYEYKVISTKTPTEKEFNTAGKEGWRLVGCSGSKDKMGMGTSFKKPVDWVFMREVL